MLLKFRTWLFEQLPDYFHSEDTYKDQNGKGIFQRYLEALGEEYDEELVDKLENFLNILDPISTDEKFLPHIAYTKGNAPDLGFDNQTYRAYLNNLVSIYQIKGTRESYVLLFRLLGYNLTLLLTFFQEDVRYDEEIVYDDEELYDMSCNSCVEYTIFLSSLEADCQNPQDFELLQFDAELMAKFKKIACFIEPINAKLRGIYPAIPICETAEVAFTEEVTITLEGASLYDDGNYYDDNTIGD